MTTAFHVVSSRAGPCQLLYEVVVSQLDLADDAGIQRLIAEAEAAVRDAVRDAEPTAN
jgi:hypothetical protein